MVRNSHEILEHNIQNTLKELNLNMKKLANNIIEQFALSVFSAIISASISNYVNQKIDTTTNLFFSNFTFPFLFIVIYFILYIFTYFLRNKPYDKSINKLLAEICKYENLITNKIITGEYYIAKTERAKSTSKIMSVFFYSELLKLFYETSTEIDIMLKQYGSRIIISSSLNTVKGKETVSNASKIQIYRIDSTIKILHHIGTYLISNLQYISQNVSEITLESIKSNLRYSITNYNNIINSLCNYKIIILDEDNSMLPHIK